MRKFFLGFVIAVFVVLGAGFLCVRFGLMDPRADIPVNSFERRIAMPSLDAAVDRRAPEVRNPVQPTNANLIAGMKVYQTNCASCHGDIHRPHGTLADALYPRAPQFVEDAPDMPENQNFYIIQHGIRLSGMPAWKQVLNEREMWQVTGFLSHMDKLPPQVSDAWKAVAGSSPNENSSSGASRMDMKDKNSMKMPMQ
jgi:mono/diheme cytochrome c family protein